MRSRAGVAAVVLLTAVACAGPTGWPERKDISVEGTAGQVASLSGSPVSPSPRNLMLCVVDERGEARCHHQAGVMASRVHAEAGRATCAGADVQLRAPCGGAAACRFSAVPLPAGAFGVLVVELRPMVLGVPRHVVVDRAIVSAGRASGHAFNVGYLTAALGALSSCLAPSAAAAIEVAPLQLDRTACQEGVCALRRTRLRIATRAGSSVVASARTAGQSAVEERQR
jgi:hypothetical protein